MVVRKKAARSALSLVAIALILAVGVVFNLHNNNTAYAGTPTCTWTGAGADTNWSTVANWTCDSGTVPTNGTQLVFPTSIPNVNQYVVTNDLSASNIYAGLKFSGNNDGGGANMYMVRGNTIQLAGDLDGTRTDGTLQAPNSAYIQAPLTFTTDASISGQFRIGQDQYGANTAVNIGSHTITVADNDDSPTISGLVGTGHVIDNSYQPLTLGDNSGFDGTFTINGNAISGDVIAIDPNSFGTATGGTTIGNNVNLNLRFLNLASGGVKTIGEPFTFVGKGHTEGGQTVDYGKIFIGSIGPAYNTVVASYYNTFNEVYTSASSQDFGACSGGGSTTYVCDVNFTGNITFDTDLTVYSSVQYVQFSGTLNGSGHTISLFDNTLAASPYAPVYGQLKITSASNNTATASGNYTANPVAVSITDSNTNSVYVGPLYTVSINGQRGNVTVASGGILKGSGTIGSVTSTGGELAPGNSPGILSTGNVSFDSSTKLDEEIGGTAAGSYDQLNVTGTVSLGGATLNLTHYGGFLPSLNDKFTIINNDGTDAVTGTFNGLAQGATFVVDGVTYTINYAGGDGNDVVLTATSVPAAPNTAGVLASKLGYILPVAALIAAAGIWVGRAYMLKNSKRR